MALEDFEFQLQAEQRYTGAAVGGQQAGNTYVDPSDGTVYEWDEKQRGWVPKVTTILINAHPNKHWYMVQVDDDFLARYQASYGVQSDTSAPSSEDGFAVPKAPPDRFAVPPVPPDKVFRAG